jgi:sugar phosphate isomerase/epimerase
VTIQIGINARLFPSNWRPALQEIAFAHKSGFTSIQLPGPEQGLDAERLGAPPAEVGAALRDAGIQPVMEMVVRMDATGRTHSGSAPLDLLRANLPAIQALGCYAVHWHMVVVPPLNDADNQALEQMLAPEFVAAVALAETHGFRFGVEHNEPALKLFATPESCAALLDRVPGLGFVWDLNHTTPDTLAKFLDLTSRMTTLHVADTPLPEPNHHLPVGMGTIDFAAYFRELLARGFAGPAILEIGGLPKSGGYGRDTDAALIDSGMQLRAAIATARYASMKG